MSTYRITALDDLFVEDKSTTRGRLQVLKGHEIEVSEISSISSPSETFLSNQIRVPKFVGSSMEISEVARIVKISDEG